MGRITITVEDDSGTMDIQRFITGCPSETAASIARPACLAETGPLGKLTDREAEILRLVVAGLSYDEVAETLVISERTVRNHMEHVTGKLDCSSRWEAGALAFLSGLVTPDDVLEVWRTHRAHFLVEN